MKEFDFSDLSVIEIPINIAGKEYVLVEASGDAVCKYRNALMSSTQLGPEGKPQRLIGMANAEPLLVSLCLFTAEPRKPVSESTIRAWPSRVQEALFDKIKEISEMDEEEETVEGLQKQRAELDEKLAKFKKDSLGNEPKATEDGSS